MWKNCNEKALIVVENVCPHCGQHLTMNKKSFANHVRWCKENPKYEEICRNTSDKIRNRLKEKIDEEQGSFKEFEVTCAKCGKLFTVTEREKEFPKKEKYYCSINCRNSHTRTLESRQKTSASIRKYIKEKGHIDRGELATKPRICPICGKEFYSPRPNQKTCSQECGCKLKLRNYYMSILNDDKNGKIIQKIYKRLCSFNFPLKDYPNEFEFNLIAENGWYKASNHGNNLNGISRDHIFSINEAFKEHIDPYYISHPANCKLLVHSDNSSKHTKCGITKEELFLKVREWNEKYGEYPNKIDYDLLKECDYQLK